MLVSQDDTQETISFKVHFNNKFHRHKSMGKVITTETKIKLFSTKIFVYMPPCLMYIYM